MQFSRFLTGLIEHGRALVSEQEPIWDDAAIDLLSEMDVAVRANLAGTAPPFQLAPAQWAAEIIYYASHACVCRHIDQEKVKEHLRRPCPEKRRSHDVIYSADLLLRYLPNVWQLAKRIAPDDPLVQELRALGTEWPLSSVGIAGIENADPAPFADHPSLMTLYVDRIMAANDHSRINDAPYPTPDRARDWRASRALSPIVRTLYPTRNFMISLEVGRRLTAEVLEPMKRDFVGKDEIIDLLGVCLVGGENLFILGPPGTAKSALVHSISARLEGETFDYLLTRFTEPNELFGPFDIRKLREGELLTNTEGMLPEASLVFLDELLNANSAILNSLLTALNERIFRRGKETRPLKALMFVGASNHLPEDDALKALFDRFLLRVHCDNVATEQLPQVLDAGWKLGLDLRGSSPAAHAGSLHFDDVRALNALLGSIDLTPVRQPYSELIHRIRYAGIPVSDRRAVKLQRLMAASAILCGRMAVQLSDLWVLRYIWDTEEQREVLGALVQQVLSKAETNGADHHRARANEEPDPESLARDVDYIATHLKEATGAESAYLKDRLSILNNRCQWVSNQDQRDFLAKRIAELWPQFDK